MKRISVIGSGGSSALAASIVSMLVSSGHHVVSQNDRSVNFKKSYERLDVSDFKQPVNGYQKKQRKRKGQKKANRGNQMKFYVNKHPIHDGWSENSNNEEPKYIPVGTVFTIECINGNGFEMKPIDKKLCAGNRYFVDPPMLSIAFSETDYIPQPEGRQMTKKIIYQCAVDGCLPSGIYKNGRELGAICGYSKVNGVCGAHGNFKCEHKRNSQPEGKQMRELKFRAWDKRHGGYMRTFDSHKDGLLFAGGELMAASGYDSCDNPTFDEDISAHIEVMQFTGLNLSLIHI